MFGIGDDNSGVKFYADMFHCQVEKLCMRYFEMPDTFTTLKTIGWDFLDKKLIKKLDVWIGNASSLGAKLIFLYSILYRVPLYYILMLF
jgi:hypothetical protein